MSFGEPTSSGTTIGGTSDVYIRATKILCEAVNELGGTTEPIYENVSWYSSPYLEHEVSFKIPDNGHGEGTTDISICGLSAEGTRQDDAHENVARHALELLCDEYCINVLDYNWFKTEELRGRCIPLVEKLIESEKIYEFVHTKCLMVIDGIEFASDLFVNKACELENEQKHGHVHAKMILVLRECARYLKNIGQSSAQELSWDHGFHTMLQRGTRSNFVKPYADYVRLKSKAGAININSGLKIILHQVASKTGFQVPALTVDNVIGSGYIGNVQLNSSLPNGVAHKVHGKLSSEQSEAASSAMYRAIAFLEDVHGLNIVDPNFYILRDLKNIEAAIKTELRRLAQRTSGVERIAHFAVNDIHKLADKHDGSITENDTKIKSMLISMCIDWSRHLDSVYNLLNIAWKNYRSVMNLEG